ncbi:thioredoxin domain-containing protein [Breoghania sp. JC706]|uniref:thioredoxin domain-containing protein n=1 Tax=Breoghania sp. JC706 TaxID=3117732 RepID=UPI00300B8946
MTGNLLANETSPYLLQHKDNPVHWRPWNAAALAEARMQNKPILLSVGYAACHWCHVMAHESFEDQATADVINAHFIPIKVDREERPDVDQIYMNALHALGQQGGWPLTMFLTPQAEPFWGGTYFPKQAQWGRPGFVEVLRQIARIHENEGEKVASNADALMHVLKNADQHAQSGEPLTPELLDTAANRLLAVMDPLNGGTRGAPKFPQASLLELLWRAGMRTGDRRFREIVLTTLRTICSGGIYDHLGGGFARYAVDERWLVPHFEKMLYDNAQLVSLLTEAFVSTGEELFRIRIEETIDWLRREMTTAEGAFAASLDADSEGEEGRFYVWDHQELKGALTREEFALFAETYDVLPAGNWEGKVILNRLRSTPLADSTTEARLTTIRARLMDIRSRRVRPGLDDKVLADWNGLMIAALVRASDVFERPEWLEAAERAFHFITESMVRDGRLGHSWRNGRLSFPGLASDHANIIKASLALFRVTNNPTYLSKAQDLELLLYEYQWDRENSGYFLTAADADDLIVRPKGAVDEAVPSANGIMAANLVELWLLTGEDIYRERADAILHTFTDQILQNAFASTSLLNAFDFRLHARQLVLLEPEGETHFSELLRQTVSYNLTVLRRSGNAELPSSHPARGKPAATPGTATAYLCKGETCSLPMTDPVALLEALRSSADASHGSAV